MLFRDIYIANRLQGGVLKYRQNCNVCINAIVVVIRQCNWQTCLLCRCECEYRWVNDHSVVGVSNI